MTDVMNQQNRLTLCAAFEYKRKFSVHVRGSSAVGVLCEISWRSGLSCGFVISMTSIIATIEPGVVVSCHCEGQDYTERVI